MSRLEAIAIAKPFGGRPEVIQNSVEHQINGRTQILDPEILRSAPDGRTDGRKKFGRKDGRKNVGRTDGRTDGKFSDGRTEKKTKNSKCVSNDRSRHDDSESGRIVKIGAILEG